MKANNGKAPGLTDRLLFTQYDAAGRLRECAPSVRCHVETPLGMLVPRYEDDGERQKQGPSLAFYENGAVKSVALQQQTVVPTPLGPLPAELVTFYPGGALKRLFPLNGRLSGFWPEENEYRLAPVLSLHLPFGPVLSKAISLAFYESGSVRSLTLWPRDHLVVPTPAGAVDIRIGVSFYENGAIRSVEPRFGVPVRTEIGTLKAYDIEACGICGDLSSLRFTAGGEVEALKTSASLVAVSVDGGETETYGPELEISHFDDGLKRLVPLSVAFEKDRVIFSGEKSYHLSEARFSVSAFRSGRTSNTCPGCDGNSGEA